LFGGIVGSVPIIADGLVLYWRGDFAWHTFMAKGDALLVGAVLAGSVIGRLALWEASHKAPKLIAICACVVSLAVSSWQYAALHYATIVGREEIASSFVLALYLFSVAASCIAAAISG
jgi:hypothetical protein